jgi:hypothetical protein
MGGWDVREHRCIDNTEAGGAFNTEICRKHLILARLLLGREASNTRIDDSIVSATTRHACRAHKVIKTEIVCIESDSKLNGRELSKLTSRLYRARI